MIDTNNILTLEDFSKIKDGEIFLIGNGINSEKDIHITSFRNNAEITWVAKKGYGNDFAIYCGFKDQSSYLSVSEYGDKLMDLKTVKRLINCDDAVLQRYRK